MKNLTLKLTLLTLIAGTAFVPQHADAMNWKKWLILGAVGAGLIYDIIEYNQTEEQLNKKLLSASESGDIETLKNCLYHAAHLNTKDNHGRTPLMLACYGGHTDIVECLVENGAPLDTQNNNNQTAYDIAVQEGRQRIVQYLLDVQKEQLNQKLLSASQLGDLTSVKNCLDSGAHLNTKDKDGNTPLMWACDQGHTDIVQYLVEKGAHLNTQNNNNQTAYDIAVQEGFPRIVQYLLDVQKEQVNQKLLSASQLGDLTSVKNCLDYGANVNTQDNDGNTPLMWACRKGNTNIVQYLIKNGANVNTQDIYGYTPLILAGNKGHTDVVQYLVENGANLNTKNNSGRTPLMWACYWGKTDTVQYLVENGAPLNTQDQYGRTAYGIALQQGRQSTAKYLADIQNGLKKFKINPLQLITIAPKSTFIKMLYKERIYYIDTSKYTDLCSIFAMFQKSNNHNELKKILNDCKFLQCSKKEIKELKKSGFSLTSDQFDMQLILLKHKNDTAFIDIVIE